MATHSKQSTFHSYLTSHRLRLSCPECPGSSTLEAVYVNGESRARYFNLLIFSKTRDGFWLLRVFGFSLGWVSALCIPIEIRAASFKLKRINDMQVQIGQVSYLNDLLFAGERTLCVDFSN